METLANLSIHELTRTYNEGVGILKKRKKTIRILEELLVMQPNGREASKCRRRILESRDDIRRIERFTPVLLERIEQVKVEIHEAQQREKDQIVQRAEEKQATDRANKKAAKRAAAKALRDRKRAKALASKRQAAEREEADQEIARRQRMSRERTAAREKAQQEADAANAKAAKVAEDSIRRKLHADIKRPPKLRCQPRRSQESPYALNARVLLQIVHQHRSRQKQQAKQAAQTIDVPAEQAA